MKTNTRPSRSSLVFSLLLALATPLGVTSCDNNQAAQLDVASQEEIAALKKAKSKLEAEVKQLRADGDKASSDLMKRNQTMEKSCGEVKAQFERLQDETSKARKDLQEHMAKYRVSFRSKLKGQSIPTLKTTDAQTFQAVKLREVTATEISFAHTGGVTRVPMEKLTPDLQAQFLYNPEEQKELEAAKAAAAGIGTGLEGIEGIENLVQKDPNRMVNPTVIHNLRTRIQTRQKEVVKAKTEMARVRQEGDDATNLGKYRLQVLEDRAARMRNEIKLLVGLLEKELNG